MREKYESLSAVVIRDLAKARGIKGISTAKKSEVIELMLEEDEKDKLLVRPGISGYTQAYYRNNLGVREKRLYDAWYAHNVSLWLDVKILFRTCVAVLKKDNVYTNDSSKK